MASRRSRKSTIVRFFQLGTFAAIRTAFGAAERIAPSWGAAWAERLWWRLPPSPRLRPIEPPGVRFRFDVDGATAYGWVWEPDAETAGETVYLMHGWGGATTQFGAFVPELLAAGYRVVGFDAPSHGESDPGRWGAGRSSIPELADALTAAIAAQGPAYAVIAHSIGCPAVATAVREGLATKRLAFLAPAGRPEAYTYVFAKRLGFGERIRTRMVRRVEQRVGLTMAHFDVPPIAAEVEVPPVLVVHDRDDRETLHRDGEAIAADWPGARMVSTTGLGHNRLLRDPGVVRQVVAHLTGDRTRRG